MVPYSAYYSDLVEYIKNFSDKKIFLNVRLGVVDCLRLVSLFANWFLLICSFSVLIFFLASGDKWHIVNDDKVIMIGLVLFSGIAFINEIPYISKNKLTKEYSDLHNKKNRYYYVCIVYILYYINIVAYIQSANLFRYDYIFASFLFFITFIPFLFICHRNYSMYRLKYIKALYEIIDKALQERYKGKFYKDSDLKKVVSAYTNLIYIVHKRSKNLECTFFEIVAECCIAHLAYHIDNKVEVKDFTVGKVVKIS